jgi:hypothetical protein
VLAGESIAKLEAASPPVIEAAPATIDIAPLAAPVEATQPSESRFAPAPRPDGPTSPGRSPTGANGHADGPRDGAPVVDGYAERGSTCTAPQLRRFIKSRPYVPMHELRRRFGIDGTEDEVTGVALTDGRIYVGLPEREGALLGDLLRGGEIGYELSLDPRTPVVIGVYPMRPVPRA